MYNAPLITHEGMREALAGMQEVPLYDALRRDQLCDQVLDVFDEDNHFPVFKEANIPVITNGEPEVMHMRRVMDQDGRQNYTVAIAPEAHPEDGRVYQFAAGDSEVTCLLSANLAIPDPDAANADVQTEHYRHLVQRLENALGQQDAS